MSRDRSWLLAASLLCLSPMLFGAGCEFSLGFRAEVHNDADGGPPPIPDGPYPEGFVPPDGQPPRPDGTPSGPDQGPVDPCAGLACTTPPAPRCVDGKTLERSNPIGTCVGGSCSYTKQTETCAGSCVGGSCLTSSTILHVDGRNGGSEQGTAKAPYRSISAAISAAGSNTAILVAGGTYNEKVSISGKTLELIGGYPGGSAADYSGGTGGDFNGRDPSAHETRIEASSGPVLRLQSAATSLVAGFTITGGGRGVSCSGGSPTISGCRITNNNASGSSGAGVYASSCALTLADSIVDGNTGSRGGGIAAESSQLTVERCLIKDNESRDDHGGGLYIAGGSITLRDNRIEGNVVGVSLGYGWGGGVAFIDAKATMRGNVVTKNRATTSGSGVFVDDGSDASLENELYVANVCGDSGSALFVDGLNASQTSSATLLNVTIADHKCSGGVGHAVLVDNATVTVRNAIFWNNGGGEVHVGNGSLQATYTNSQKKLPGAGNISVNPGFAGSGDAAYHLRSSVGRWDGSKWVKDASGSPCLDVGDGSTGVGSEPTPNGGRANLGAFGRTPTASKSN